MENTINQTDNAEHKNQDSAPPDPDECQQTCEEVLEGAILELVSLGYQNGMSPDDVDWVIEKIMNDRCRARRASFILHTSGEEEDDS